MSFGVKRCCTFAWRILQSGNVRRHRARAEERDFKIRLAECSGARHGSPSVRSSGCRWFTPGCGSSQQSGQRYIR